MELVCWIQYEYLAASMGNSVSTDMSDFCPKLPSGADDPLKAVMVFIHGGGFSTGSGTSEFYGPDFLLSENVVVVTLNYRLGALGKLLQQ
jgi:acetyl esterase/lipase